MSAELETRAFAYKTEAEALYFASSIRGVEHFERIATDGHAGFSITAPDGYVFTATIEPREQADGFPFSVVVGLVAKGRGSKIWALAELIEGKIIPEAVDDVEDLDACVDQLRQCAGELDDDAVESDVPIDVRVALVEACAYWTRAENQLDELRSRLKLERPWTSDMVTRTIELQRLTIIADDLRAQLKSKERLEYDFDLAGHGGRVRVWSVRGSYDGWRLELNDQRVPVTKVERYRDGGTTYVRCELGVLFSPAPSKRDPPTWTDARGPGWTTDPPPILLTRHVPKVPPATSAPDDGKTGAG